MQTRSTKKRKKRTQGINLSKYVFENGNPLPVTYTFKKLQIGIENQTIITKQAHKQRAQVWAKNGTCIDENIDKNLLESLIETQEVISLSNYRQLMAKLKRMPIDTLVFSNTGRMLYQKKKNNEEKFEGKEVMRVDAFLLQQQRPLYFYTSSSSSRKKVKLNKKSYYALASNKGVDRCTPALPRSEIAHVSPLLGLSFFSKNQSPKITPYDDEIAAHDVDKVMGEWLSLIK